MLCARVLAAIFLMATPTWASRFEQSPQMREGVPGGHDQAFEGLSKRKLIELQDRLVQTMVQDGAFDLEEDRYEIVLEAIRGGDVSGDALEVALVLWKDGQIRDPEIMVSAIRKGSASAKAAKLIELADQLYRLRLVAEKNSGDWETIGATAWTRVRRDNYYRWAEERLAELRGVSPELEKQIDALFEQHRQEMAAHEN